MTLNRRSRHAKHCTKSLQQPLEVETNLSLQSNKSDQGAINSLKALKNMHIDLKLLQDGDTILLPRRIHLHHHDGNRAATCGQREPGFRGNLHDGLSSDFSNRPRMNDFISLAGNSISWQSTGDANSTPTAHTIFSCTVVAQTCCQSVQSHIDPMRMHGSSHEAHCLHFAQKHSDLIAQCRTSRHT